MSFENNQTCNRTAGALFCVHVVLQSLHLCYSQSVAIQPCPIIVSRVAILPNPQQASYLHIVSRVAMMPNPQQSSAGRESVPPWPPSRVAKSYFAMERKHRDVEIRTDKVVNEEKIEHEPRGLNDYFSKSDWDMLEGPTSVDGKKRVVSERLCSLD